MALRRGRWPSMVAWTVSLTATLGALGALWGARHRVSGMQGELSRSQRELARLREELRWVRHRATHDLRNPLTPIVARAEMLKRSVERPEELRQVEAILRAASKMSRMIEDLATRAASAQ